MSSLPFQETITGDSHEQIANPLRDALHCFGLPPVLFNAACTAKIFGNPDGTGPAVKVESTYSVVEDVDITFAEARSRSIEYVSFCSAALKLDVYYPDNDSTDRPVYMFIHGGGFTGGTKTKPEIVDMVTIMLPEDGCLLLLIIAPQKSCVIQKICRDVGTN